jgi:hypothetical protein
MQQSYTRQLIFNIGRSVIIGRRNYAIDNTKNRVNEHEQHDNTLICPTWEEAIIKEHRKPDLPFDLMQKDTIDIICNDNNNRSIKEQSVKKFQ